IAHDIRNPVSAARSLAQLLARRPDSPRATVQIELIVGELDRVERQVAALLRFARRDELRPERVDLSALARATVETCRTWFHADRIAVTVEAGDGVIVYAAAEKIRQVLLNLIENAAAGVRASEERGVTRTGATAHGTRARAPT